ncbi:hypothetical protein Gferi_11450 [Geosporobacter ferrireducens]|uniref:ABC1 atypical kinase-like domain-containing protein n=2 Tax=Geosporobacter ferrireducens TaxID=1424294 RepID=A0A1D8GGX7_9FIRM|nr:hypothetical protein Gferi_11450 [Geosporobacter ferrireducens]
MINMKSKHMRLGRKYKLMKFLFSVIKEESQNTDQLFELLGELKGVPQKFGQFLYLKDRRKYTAFGRLLDEGIPVKDHSLYTRARQLTGHRIDLAEAPIAAASIGQVYGGDFESNPVIVKIQYPEVQANMDHDFRFMKKVFNFFFNFFRFPWESKALLTAYLQEFEDTFQVETDYFQEEKLLMRFHEVFSDNSSFFIPKVYTQFTKKDIIVEEKCTGTPLKLFLKSAPENEKRVALDLLFSFYFQSFFQHGILHGDPHSGNFFIRKSQEKLLLEVIDFGCVKEYDQAFVQDTASLIRCLRKESYHEVPQLLINLGFKEDEIASYGKALAPILDTIFEPLLLDEAFDFKYWKLTYKLNTIMGSKVFEKTLSLPKDLLILFRVFHGCIAHIYHLDEKVFNVYPYVDV